MDLSSVGCSPSAGWEVSAESDPSGCELIGCWGSSMALGLVAIRRVRATAEFVGEEKLKARRALRRMTGGCVAMAIPEQRCG